jgi:hypothetical protein
MIRKLHYQIIPMDLSQSDTMWQERFSTIVDDISALRDVPSLSELDRLTVLKKLEEHAQHGNAQGGFPILLSQTPIAGPNQMLSFDPQHHNVAACFIHYPAEMVGNWEEHLEFTLKTHAERWVQIQEWWQKLGPALDESEQNNRNVRLAITVTEALSAASDVLQNRLTTLEGIPSFGLPFAILNAYIEGPLRSLKIRFAEAIEAGWKIEFHSHHGPSGSFTGVFLFTST